MGHLTVDLIGVKRRLLDLGDLPGLGHLANLRKLHLHVLPNLDATCASNLELARESEGPRVNRRDRGGADGGADVNGL